MSKRIPFLTLYSSYSGGHTPTPHSAWVGDEPDYGRPSAGSTPFVFDAAAMQLQPDHEGILGAASGLSLLAAALKLVEIVQERTIVLKVPLEVDGPSLTDVGEVAVQFTLGELPPEVKPAEQKPADKSAAAPAGEAEPPATGAKPPTQPQTKPKEPTLKERLDAFFDQLAPQSKALTGKEFRLEKGAGLLFISSERLPAFFRATQKTWGGLDQLFRLLGISNRGGQSLDLFERAALSMIVDTPDLGPEDKEEFEIILHHLEGTGSRLTGDFHRAYREMSHAFSSIPELPTDLRQLRAALKLSAMPADAVSYMRNHSAFAQLLFQLIFVYESGGSIINQRVTTVFQKYGKYEKNPPADKGLAAFGLFMYGEFVSRIIGMGNKVTELEHTPTHTLERTREDWVEQREMAKELAPDAEDLVIFSPFYSDKLRMRLQRKEIAFSVREILLEYTKLSKVGDVLAVAAIFAVAVLDVLIEDLDEELAKRRANPEGP